MAWCLNFTASGSCFRAPVADAGGACVRPPRTAAQTTTAVAPRYRSSLAFCVRSSSVARRHSRRRACALAASLGHGAGETVRHQRAADAAVVGIARLAPAHRVVHPCRLAASGRQSAVPDDLRAAHRARGARLLAISAVVPRGRHGNEPAIGAITLASTNAPIVGSSGAGITLSSTPISPLFYARSLGVFLQPRLVRLVCVLRAAR